MGKTQITRMDITAEYRDNGSQIAYFTASFQGTPGSFTMTKQIIDRAAYDLHKVEVDSAFDDFEDKAISQSELFDGE